MTEQKNGMTPEEELEYRRQSRAEIEQALKDHKYPEKGRRQQ